MDYCQYATQLRWQPLFSDMLLPARIAAPVAQSDSSPFSLRSPGPRFSWFRPVFAPKNQNGIKCGIRKNGAKFEGKTENGDPTRN